MQKPLEVFAFLNLLVSVHLGMEVYEYRSKPIPKVVYTGDGPCDNGTLMEGYYMIKIKQSENNQ